MRYAVFVVWPAQNEADLVAFAWDEGAAQVFAEHWRERGFSVSIRIVQQRVNLNLPEFQFIDMPGVELPLAQAPYSWASAPRDRCQMVEKEGEE